MTETNMRLEDWLDDLCVRFIINLPEEDLSSVERICFHVEEAQWFYEDFIRPLDPTLPSMSLRSFCLRIFQHCPLLSGFSYDNQMKAFEEFLLYKTRVPVRGAIMLNESMDSVVLVKGWKKGANWSFPRGKINKDEDDLDCAVREVYEETGFDIREAGLVPTEENVKYIEMTMRDQHMRLYVFRDVPMNTLFEPKTRKEISKIEWYRLSDLPAFKKKGHPQAANAHAEAAINANKFYMVAPFLVNLKKWIGQQKKKDAEIVASKQFLEPSLVHEETLTEEKRGHQYHDSPSLNEAKVIKSTPDVHTLEGATEALHRLLKIQPATQGIQTEAARAMAPSSTSRNTGEQLLALLHGKSPTASNDPPTAQKGPQIIRDHLLTEPTMPDIHHHQQPRQMGFSELPDPPNFPSRYSNNEENHYTQHPQPQPTHDMRHTHSYDQQLPLQRAYAQGYGSQQLRHPQPLPPQVQRAMLSGGIFHGPAVPQFLSQQQESQPAHQSSRLPNPQFQNIHAPMVNSSFHEPAPKLTSHSLALLNAFKSADQSELRDKAAKDMPSRSFAELEAPDPNMHSLDNESPEPEPTDDELPAPYSVTVPSAPRLHSHTSLPSHLRSPPEDAHRSSLLNMFKQQSMREAMPHYAPSHAHSQRFDGLPDLPMNAMSGQRKPKPTNGAEDSARSPTDRVILEPRDRTAAASFRPAAILPRPVDEGKRESETKNAPKSSLDSQLQNARRHMQQQKSIHKPTSPPQRDAGSPPQQHPSFQPQILKRPQQGTSNNTYENNSPSHGSLPPSAQPPTSAPQQGEQPSEQRQTLLSLFGNGQGPPQVPRAVEQQPPAQKQALLSLFGTQQASNQNVKGMAPPPVPRPVQAPERASFTSFNPTTMSRVSSLASAGGESRSSETGRRESHTPISPADKGFLLGYLDKAVKGSGR